MIIAIDYANRATTMTMTTTTTTTATGETKYRKTTKRRIVGPGR